MRIELVTAWYDVWIGAYFDRRRKSLYLMIPFIGIKISESRKPESHPNPEATGDVQSKPK